MNTGPSQKKKHSHVHKPCAPQNLPGTNTRTHPPNIIWWLWRGVVQFSLHSAHFENLFGHTWAFVGVGWVSWVVLVRCLVRCSWAFQHAPRHTHNLVRCDVVLGEEGFRPLVQFFQTFEKCIWMPVLVTLRHLYIFYGRTHCVKSTSPHSCWATFPGSQGRENIKTHRNVSDNSKPEAAARVRAGVCPRTRRAHLLER